MSKPSGERRTYPRTVASFELAGRPESGGAMARMIARDLSLGGLCCTSSTDFPEMTRLAVRLLLPQIGRQETLPVDAQAVVVRREVAAHAGNGEPRFVLSLFFTRIDARARKRLRTFLER